MSVRPLNDWVLVRLNPEAKRKGLVTLAEIETKNKIVTGTVLAKGPGRWADDPEVCIRSAVDLELGDKVAFFSANYETSAGEQLYDKMQELEEGTGLVRADSILFTVDPSVELEFEV